MFFDQNSLEFSYFEIKWIAVHFFYKCILHSTLAAITITNPYFPHFDFLCFLKALTMYCQIKGSNLLKDTVSELSYLEFWYFWCFLRTLTIYCGNWQRKENVRVLKNEFEKWNFTKSIGMSSVVLLHKVLYCISVLKTIKVCAI